MTERMAWAWMIEAASWKATRVRVGGQIVSLERGQLVGSVRFLADKWQWSKSRVDRFLHRLRCEGMIGTETKSGTNVVTVCNYDKYQATRDADDTDGGTAAGQEWDSSGTPSGTPSGTAHVNVTDCNTEAISDRSNVGEAPSGTEEILGAVKSGTTKKEVNKEIKKEEPNGSSGSRASSKRGARLSPDWQPSEAGVAFCRECGLDLDRTLAEFRDYWVGVPGSKGVKLDWEATFRNRCRDLAERRPQSRAAPAATPSGEIARSGRPWQMLVDGFREKGKWLVDSFPPGDSRCQVPDQFLQPHEIAAKRRAA
jgi:hypothetical protein